MKFALLAITLVFFAVAFGSEDSDVITLDADNFDEELAKNSVLLVEFYAPWCGHCKTLAPEYEKAATIMKEQNVAARIAKMDADDSKNAPIRERFEIRGFPTIKLFRDGKEQSEFAGDRTAAGIASYMRKQSSPASTKLTTVDAATAFKDSDRVVVIGFFDNADSEEYTNFAKVAGQLREKYTFGEVIGASDVNAALGATSSPSVTLFKKFDELKNVFEELTNVESLTKFIQQSGTPLIDEIGPHNFKNYVESNIPLLYLFVDLTKDGQLEENLPHVQDLAKSTKGKLNYVYIDWAKYAKHSERLGLSGSTVPAIAIEHIVDGTHYVFDEKTALTKEGVTEWINSFLDGKLQPTIKSEPIPENNDGPVKVLVADNFDSIVYDTTKDVLVEFYAPWCGHCKKLTPIYEELGTELKSSHPNVVIAKIDATANDVHPKFGIRGFPTLKFFPSNNKDTPTDYEGDRSLADLKDFVVKNTVAVASERDEL